MFEHPLSYCAGVMDAVGVFALRPTGGAIVRTWKIRDEVAQFLHGHLGGYVILDTLHQAYWYCPPEEQRETCARLIPYLKAKRDAASAVMQYRYTQPARAMGWRVSDAVKKFRKDLSERLLMSTKQAEGGARGDANEETDGAAGSEASSAGDCTRDR